MASVKLADVECRYGDTIAVRRCSLSVAAGEFLTLLGPSGSGKTTLLRAIGGYVRPHSGAITVAGADVTSMPPQGRNMGMVFQNYALFPHMNVFANVAFGLKVRSLTRTAIAQRVREALALVQLEGREQARPHQLSGGQQQRVALARAIVIEPSVLLMDEPLGALDLKLRESMQLEIRRIQRELGITALYVTHDQSEAFAMSDRIAVINEGELVEVGTPQELYAAPRSHFTAQFVGQASIVRADVQRWNGTSGEAVPRGWRSAVLVHGEKPPEEEISLLFRPEAMGLSSQAGPRSEPATVAAARFTGSGTFVTLRLSNAEVVALDQSSVLREGDVVHVSPPAEAHVLTE